jgi:hypothetical protein
MNGMSEVFDMKRFGRYAWRSFGVNKKQYIRLAVTVPAVMIVALLFARMSTEYLDGRQVRELWEFYFNLVLPVYMVSFVLLTMKPLKDRYTMTAENTIPVSATEKFLFVFLATTLVPAVVFLLSFSVTSILGVAFTDTWSVDNFFGNVSWYRNVFRVLLWVLVPLHAAMLYAGTMERRSHALSFMLVVMTVIAAVLLLIGVPALTGERFAGIYYAPLFVFDSAVVQLTDASVMYYLPSWSENSLTATFLALTIAIVLWVAAWFNFRERSVK